MMLQPRAKRKPIDDLLIHGKVLRKSLNFAVGGERMQFVVQNIDGNSNTWKACLCITLSEASRLPTPSQYRAETN
eukprot:3149859-Amphidinium_carterae.1